MLPVGLCSRKVLKETVDYGQPFKIRTVLQKASDGCKLASGRGLCKIQITQPHAPLLELAFNILFSQQCFYLCVSFVFTQPTPQMIDRGNWSFYHLQKLAAFEVQHAGDVVL